MVVHILLLVIFLLIGLYAACSKTSVVVNLTQRFMSILPLSNEVVEEIKQEDDLPPYSPPSPKTEASMTMTDLPPSYEETFDITDVGIPNYSESNKGILNMHTSNSISISTVANNVDTSPETYTNPDITDTLEIVIDPLNTHTTSVV